MYVESLKNEQKSSSYDDIFIDMNGKSWRKIRSKGYVVMGEDETLVSTATLLSDDHGCYKYADVERDIEGGENEDEATAKILFEEFLEIRKEGKIYWE